MPISLILNRRRIVLDVPVYIPLLWAIRENARMPVSQARNIVAESRNVALARCTWTASPFARV